MKPILKDIKDFLIYLVIEPFIQVGLELKEIWKALTTKKTWVWVWFWISIIFMVFRIDKWAMFSIVMCFSFLIIYQWQVGTWKYKQRKRWKAKMMKNQQKKPKKQ